VNVEPGDETSVRPVLPPTGFEADIEAAVDFLNIYHRKGKVPFLWRVAVGVWLAQKVSGLY
jgi:hypothetical protein